jgi:hypothetical protein
MSSRERKLPVSPDIETRILRSVSVIRATSECEAQGFASNLKTMVRRWSGHSCGERESFQMVDKYRTYRMNESRKHG